MIVQTGSQLDNIRSLSDLREPLFLDVNNLSGKWSI